MTVIHRMLFSRSLVLQTVALAALCGASVSAFAATELGVTFPASFEQWERIQVDPDTGEIMGGMA